MQDQSIWETDEKPISRKPKGMLPGRKGRLPVGRKGSGACGHRPQWRDGRRGSPEGQRLNPLESHRTCRGSSIVPVNGGHRAHPPRPAAMTFVTRLLLFGNERIRDAFHIQTMNMQAQPFEGLLWRFHRILWQLSAMVWRAGPGNAFLVHSLPSQIDRPHDRHDIRNCRVGL